MCLLGMLHLDAPSQPTPVRVPDMFVHPHHNKANIWRESGSLPPPALYPKSMLSVLPFSNDLTTDQSAGALVERKSDVISVPGCPLPLSKAKNKNNNNNNSDLRPLPKVLVAWSTHHLLPPPTSSPSLPRLTEARVSISHESSADTRLLDDVGHSCRDNAGSRPMNGPERPIMTGTTNGGGIGSDGRAWLNDVTAVVSATAANNNNNNPASNPHHSVSLNNPRLHEPPPLLRAAAASSLFRPPISLATTQDYSPNSSSHLYSQFPALHGNPSYYPPPPPPPSASHGPTLAPPPSLNPYSYYPLQFPSRGYPNPPTASIIPRPFPQMEPYHSSVLAAGMGSHPRSAFLPSQYSSSLNPSSSSPNETVSFSLMPPRTHATYGPVQYPSAESETHSPNKEQSNRHKTSSSTSSISSGTSRHRSETMPGGKSCSPGLVVVDKRDLSPHIRDSVSSLSREQMQQMSYRVPSGKEGSLKHRILTRPPDIHIEHSALSAEKSPDTCTDSSPKQLKPPVASPAATSISMPCTPLRTSGSAWRSPPPPPMSAGATPLRYPAHFVKGSIIQLANGELKSVEELRTEDFVQSAELSADLKIDSSTVVRIEENGDANKCTLGFSVGEQRVQVTVEAALEHPFFVFGQGWSSCLPDRTQQRYNLQCKKLQVGDVCISLTHKDQQPSTRSVASLIRPPPTDACARIVGLTKPNDDTTTPGVIIPPQTHSIETQTQTLSSGGATQITSCRPSAACFFPPPTSTSDSQPASFPRKRRWSAPDKVVEEFKPRTKFS